MKISSIYQYLNELSPFELQQSWDNSGLIVGSYEDSFDEVVISLDLDLEIVEKIKPNSLILTHHPLIFKAIKKLNFNDYQTILLQKLIKKDLKLISLHTNFDITYLNKYVFEKILGFNITYEKDFILKTKQKFKFNDLVGYVREKLQLDYIKVVKVKDEINSIALTTGSGMSLLDLTNADCFLTGDIKYHEAMDAKVRGINLIDIGHFESEKYFCDVLYEKINSYLTLNKINCIILNSKNPFNYKEGKI